jgi:hypothetical protein
MPPAAIRKPPWIFPRAEEALHHETHTGGTSPYTPLSNTARSRVKKCPSSYPRTTRVPSEEEVEAVMQLGNAGPLPIPSIFPYVEGMPVIVNQNKYLGLKVANGSRPLELYQILMSRNMWLTKACLSSSAHLPLPTIMLGTESEAYMPGPVPKALSLLCDRVETALSLI